MTKLNKGSVALLVLLSAMTAHAQNTAVTWSGFNMGFASTASVTTNAQSVAGQLTVGSAQSSSTAIESGFIPGTSGPPSVTAAFTVTTVSDSVVGSLRWAIQNANAASGLNVIAFNILGSGVHTILLTTPLPIFTDAVIVDGYTQPGTSPNTNGQELGSNAVLKIRLSGPGVFSDVHGIVLRGGGSTVRGLLINGFTSAISLETLGVNTIEGNFIGTDSLGATARPNRWGVYVQSAGNIIGGNSAAARNVISGNYSDGIFISGVNATNNRVLGNYLGTSASGIVDLANGYSGIWLEAPGNVIGGTNANARNIILGGANDAVYLAAGNAGGNTIQGNYIGTNAAGTGGLSAAGVYILTSNNIIANNVISGVRSVRLQGAAAMGNVIQGNLVGLSADGTTALSNNNGVGIDLLRVSHTIIGGVTSEERNVITVRSHGVSIAEGDSNVVRGNYIGTNAAGTIGLVSGGAAGSGVYIASANNVIGGTVAGARNVIANNHTGVSITGGAAGNSIQGNFIGTNATGTAAIGNTNRGIVIFTQANELTHDNFIGGEVSGAGNVISGNMGPGISVTGANANTIQGNFIGLAADGISPLPNASDGIQFGSGDSNLIGGFMPDAGNRIAFNGVGFANSRANGIKLVVGTGNEILGNSIYANQRLGIDLVGGTENLLGVTTNDSCDADAGPNGLQNYPVLTSAIPGTDQVIVQGRMNSGSYGTFLIQFFSSPALDTSGYGGGKNLLGSTYVTTNSNCVTAFDVTLPVSVPLGQYITSTATNAAGNTSEFSFSIASGTTSVTHFGDELPKAFALEQNYPNPFNPTTIIRYDLPVDAHVELKVYDVLGRELLTLLDEHENAGYHFITFNASGFSSGVYFYRTHAHQTDGGQAGKFVEVKRLMILK